MKTKSWYFMGLLSLINLLSGCVMDKGSKQITQFKWYPVATAPRGYPMEVISGTFYFKGMNEGLPIPSGGTLTSGWGDSGSGYSGGGELPLPDRVQVKFYSYVEKQAYQAEFNLPYDDILAKFHQQLQDAPDKLNYSRFLLGIAPGGAISVWLKGPRTTEVFFGQATKIEVSPTTAFALPFQSKEQSDDYVNSTLTDNVTPDQLAHIKAHGAPIGVWARYRNLYKWAPAYKDGKNATLPLMSAGFLNGERYDISTHFNEEEMNNLRPLPSQLTFRAHVNKDEEPVYIIDFEPIELMEAFEKLGAQGEKVYIEFDAQVPVTNMRIRIYNDKPPKDAQTPKEFIELKKFKVDP